MLFENNRIPKKNSLLDHGLGLVLISSVAWMALPLSVGWAQQTNESPPSPSQSDESESKELLEDKDSTENEDETVSSEQNAEAAQSDEESDTAGSQPDANAQQGEGEWGEFEEDWGDSQQNSGDSGGGIEELPFEFHGFVESLTAARVVKHRSTPSDLVSNEARFRLSLDASHDIASARFRGDIVADATTNNVFIDVRDASLFTQLTPWLSLRAGRQVLTWGTGDFVFLNDLFPKDFQSFFSGRRDEFLKAPANALRLSTNFSALNVDLVWLPIFAGDRFITGERFSFFNPMAGNIVGSGDPSVPVDPITPSHTLENGEFFGRIFSTIAGYEFALYGYAGFWKQPLSLDLAAMAQTYSRLAVYGSSVRGALLGGLFNLEGAFYHSHADNSGDDPTIPNSQVRALAGYEHELFTKFQAGVQYYLEYTLKHDELKANSMWSAYEQDELRHLLTLRLTYFLLQDNLELSAFTFFSPSDMDAYIRPRISYKWTDQLSTMIGANIMLGRDDFTFFGQLEQNSNVYANMRYSF
ncbi:MAG: hypothetical protein IPJ88_02730 [Myxococcales bacterium]|nr:MAG: hypothetical protein IPJ88_02730 [Myxococcales bacterium]